MSVFINDKRFYSEPGICYECPFFTSGTSDLTPVKKGFCMLFDETHSIYRYIPRRCHKLFKKAFTYPEETHLVITAEKN